VNILKKRVKKKEVKAKFVSTLREHKLIYIGISFTVTKELFCKTKAD